MNAKSLQTALQDIPLGGFRYLKQVDSTNDIALNWMEEGGQDFSLVIANEQIKGRGRDGRSWQTPPDSALAFSLLLLPSIEEAKNISLFTGLGALALVDALREHYELDAKIKWPNDVLVDEKKLAGILVEANWHGDKIKSIVLGMGVNVYANSVPDDVLFPATSLEESRPDSFNKPIRSLLLYQILEAFIKRRPSLGRGNLHNAWEENLAFRGKQVEVTSGNGQVIQGKVLGINLDGSLRLDTHQSIHFGDVHLRPMRL
ncbi:MAG: biotin--[acetyl-CoA-carboxylase] ligase [Anaerolineae bacterium]|jgi:BirA family biotin operon repressor/biotin-[acetyl-CoA-carboxylase] ligase|nr:biotin--[acetyl-CoA-carboxylase] ligase [Anaerolineae bacterium]MBT7484224.1 biotin--[acetyl-CoA-carboxylase] ligase [Candidatus Peregrinibacteria bacterium]MBT3713448.1 biotin--[acetyl-CoA-carboxylase] ligase [Anaerolineae bacterium]MBT4309024.1 biotin--[acetyl-CoA-carboxylase] ligase [Anaerolineae bacterium]MBT4458921.1 biotin--[acetyl-CoA-carboxylase] ligase [Anaerolineae bacterium]